MITRHSITAVLLALAAAASIAAAEQPRTFVLGKDRFAGGRQVVLAQQTTGDAIVAGGDVRLQAMRSVWVPKPTS